MTVSPDSHAPEIGTADNRSRADRAPATTAWHSLSPAEALAAQESGPNGLSEEEAAARLRRYGANRLPRTARAGLLKLYVRQFKSPMVYLLLAATVVSLFVGEWSDALFIFVVLQLNAVIGGLQEWRAETSAAALDKMMRNRVVVLRAGRTREIDAAALVSGDVLRLESGGRVPADLRILSQQELSVDESLLTGESLPLEKDAEATVAAAAPMSERRTLLFAGTTVLTGRARALVVACGNDTQIGRIASVLAQPDQAPPPLIARLEQASRLIGFATLVAIAGLAAVQLAQGVSLITVFLVAVALAVAAIPEGLPVAITVALSIATARMADRNVIVRALPAVEGLGACTLIASDKTGTLTCNELTVKQVLLFDDAGPAVNGAVGGEGYRPQGTIAVEGGAPSQQELAGFNELARSAALCNEAEIEFDGDAVRHLGDTVDVAFLVLAAKLGLDPGGLKATQEELGMIPYEPQRRYAAVFTADAGDPGMGGQGPDGSGGAMVHVKGALEALLPMCDGIDGERALAAAAAMAGQGYRVLAVARGTVSRDAGQRADPGSLRYLRLLGLVGLMDPLRPEVPDALRRCRSAGVSVVMVTGDHPETARVIARELGLGTGDPVVVTGAMLGRAGAGSEAFNDLVRGAEVFARVEPVQKLRIVQALQQSGHLVAVTGDGVNDAPALATADIGVAMGKGGTDVARGAADLILTDDNFASIVAGIEEGRVAYDNVRKLIYLLISTGLGEIVLFLLAIVAGLPLPLFAVQLLWLNLVTNGIQDVALAFEKGEPGVLERRPRLRDESLFDRRMLGQVLTAGGYMGFCAFAFYYWCLARGLPEAEARNLLLLLMVLFENVHAINARSERLSAFARPIMANPFLIMAVLAAQAAHIAALYLPGLSDVLGVRPVSLTDWLLVAALALSLLAVMEIRKLVSARRGSDPGTGR
ncbi:HAD-IC family P-type ATPase [Pelagibius litoralis]|uniref:HAD-IC family P-type ATPase n=1 Tax=Pelagibius litoralis TaxID=374515 RepID=A0A967EVJ2_9PROT|nr:HAD-IC family P-type ATPase [Pelagibius litoralis]NIA68582.1 HAD-IC family P-type ATPase [Pelagibius litoralis]